MQKHCCLAIAENGVIGAGSPADVKIFRVVLQCFCPIQHSVSIENSTINGCPPLDIVKTLFLEVVEQEKRGNQIARKSVRAARILGSLPALQKTFVNSSTDLELKNGGAFSVACISREAKHRKSRKQSGNTRSLFQRKTGTKIRTIRGTFVLQLF